MNLVETCPTRCLCGRYGDSSGPYVEMGYEVPGLQGWAYLCLACTVELLGLAEVMPLAEHRRLVDGFNANAAELNAKIAQLTTQAEEGARARTELEELQPLLANHESQVLGLNREIEEERRKREEAEELAAGNITVAGLRSSIAQAVEKAHAVTPTSGSVTALNVTEEEASAEPQPAARECEGCGELFEPSRADERFCKPRCRQRAYRRRKAEQVPA